MRIRRTAMSIAALSLTAPAAASEVDVFDGRWSFGEQSSVVTELQNAESPKLADDRERRFGGDSLSVHWALEAGKWFARAHYNRIDDTIRAGADFDRQIGNDRTEVVVGRHWNGHGRHWWTRKSLISTWETRRTSDGQLLADRHVAQFGIDGPKQSHLQVQYHSGKELQAGRLFDFDRVVLSGRVKPSDSVEMGVETHVGDRMDFVNARPAEQHRVQPFVRWNFGKNVAFHVNGAHVDLDTRDGQQIIDAKLVDASLIWQFDNVGSVNLALQQQDIERNQGAFAVAVAPRTREVGHRLSYTWKVSPRAEIQLGYADAFADVNAVEVLVDTNRNWFMNVGYALGM